MSESNRAYQASENQSVTCTLGRYSQTLTNWCCAIPNSLIALIARFSIAGIFWLSGQTKVEGFVLNVVNGEFVFGLPRLSDSVIPLFKDEYRLPLISAELGALLATFAEHVFPALVLLGLATRFSAFALLVMTLVIQIFVYPGAYATHGVWAAVLLYLMVHGPGKVSIDHWLRLRCR